jgi:hypothetical protein
MSSLLERTDHIIENGKEIGVAVDDNGDPVKGDLRDIPPMSGTIKMTDVATYLSLPDNCGMSNNYIKQLSQRTSNLSLDNLHGAAWGLPHETVKTQDDGLYAMQNLKKLDWRYEGQNQVNTTGGVMSNSYGNTEAFCSVRNTASMNRPAAYCANGYAVLEPGTYTLSFDFSRRKFISIPGTDGGTSTDFYIQVLSYPNGYLNGSLVELVEFEPVSTGYPAAAQSGSRSIEFTTYGSRPHIVPIWYWWCSSYQNGAPNGIEGAVKNARIIRTS